MRRGRKVNVGALIESREGSEEAKRKAALFLREFTGELTMEEVAGELGVNVAMAYKLREQMLEGVIESLEPRKLGRPAKENPPEGGEVDTLREKVKELERELQAARIREEIRVVLPGVGRRGKKK